MTRLMFLLLLSMPLFARQNFPWNCMIGNRQVVTPGSQNSTTRVMQSFPSCTVSVYNAGTLTLASIFSDNSGTVKANPFTANVNGAFNFYASNGRYDVTMSAGGFPQATTISDVLLFDGPVAGGVTSVNALTGALTTATGTAGTDFGIVSAGTTITFNFPSASAANRGLLSTTDWSTFNAKQGALSFTAPLVNTAGTVALTLPLTIGQGGTGQVTAAAAFTALSPQTTKGDLIAFTTLPIRLGVGSDGQVLTAASGQASGWQWTTPTNYWTLSGANVFMNQGGTTCPGGTADSCLGRTSAGLVEVDNGTVGTIRDFKDRHTFCGGTAPTITTHFNTSGDSIAGGDDCGAVTVGTGMATNNGVITFGTAYATAPVCLAENETTLSQGVQAVASTTTLTLKGFLFSSGAAQNFTNSVVLKYQCKTY